MKKVIAICVIIVLFFAMNLNVIATEFLTKNSVKSFLLMEAESGRVLCENNSHISLPPASVTKIMTMLLICEAIEKNEISLETEITASEKAKSMGGSTIFLETNEVMTLNDLLKGIAVASANDACVAVAEHISGSVESFVDTMNKRAKELGMKDTNFVNCNGLDAANHHTSAYDIAIMSRELLKHEMILNYTTIWMDTLRGGKFQLSNTNKLIRYYSGATGLKTGSTSGAGCCISASAKRDGMQLIAVVLGAENSKDRFSSASELLNYGFANYAVSDFGPKGSEVCRIPVMNGKQNHIVAITQNSTATVIQKQDKSNVKNHINIPENLKAPIKKGEVIGELITTCNGETISKTNLISDRTVNKMNAGDYFINLLSGLFSV